MPIGIRHTQALSVTTSSAKFTNPMQPGQQYMFTCDTNCWVKVAVTGGSAAATTADNIRYIAGMSLPLKSPDSGTTTTNSYVHVIGDAAGAASLCIVEG
jgi:hypothetical protein